MSIRSNMPIGELDCYKIAREICDIVNEQMTKNDEKIERLENEIVNILKRLEYLEKLKKEMN